jgi:hypothetical protein
MMVRRDPAGVRLLTRNGHDWTGRSALGTQRMMGFCREARRLARRGRR